MPAVQILENIYWVGVVDWDMTSFHGHTYTTKRGTTYNAYLIVDDKITLVDAVYGPFAKELIENIRQVVDPAKIDCIVANHVETDHSGALPEVLKLCPKAKVYGTAKCKEGLYRYYYTDMDFQVVKTGDELKLGRRTLRFIEAPMIHWPDSMFTYVVEDALLMPNDAFGQHLASGFRFDDEVDPCALDEESTKYYANILWPLSGLIARKIDEVVKTGIPIKMIAPSHGVIWRKDPAKILGMYGEWVKNTAKKKIVLFYETMWGSTEKMARRIADGIEAEGCELRFYNVTKRDHTDIVTEMLDAKGFIAGSSTHDNSMLPTIAGFMHFFEGLKPKGRLGAAFGSYGWAGGAVKELEEGLKRAGLEIAVPSVSARFAPSAEDLDACYAFGREFAKKVMAG